MKKLGFKVALGDVSDESHIERQLQAASPRSWWVKRPPMRGNGPSSAIHARFWLRGRERVSSSGVTRVIWVLDGVPPETTALEVASVKPSDPELVSRIVELDDAQVIS